MRFTSKAVREPVGVAGAIIPWNYPFLMAAWKVAPVLAAGCSMVLKPSELTSFTELELGAIVDEAGLPSGVLKIVTGLGAQAAVRRLSIIRTSTSWPSPGRTVYTQMLNRRGGIESEPGSLAPLGRQYAIPTIVPF